MIERAKIQSIIDELKRNSRIDEAFCAELDNSFKTESLNIGIVGKMKTGKSSLVNAVVFSDNILSTGMRPVTVTLTEITYGEKEEAVVELMSMRDIDELKESAAYSGDDASLISKAETAQDILNELSEGYERYLDTPLQTIELKDLGKFIDADGIYSGLAKSVKIYLQNNNLKGVTIIDTPGFNDPISSRGETTKNALAKCHVLLFVHNKDGYDSTDLALLTEQISYAGISEIVDILNKVDMLGDIHKWPDKLNLFKEKRNAMVIPNETTKRLIETSNAIYVSSLMALCGLIPLEKMDDNMKSHYSCFEENFEVLCQYSDKNKQQEAFVKISNVKSVIDEINRLSREGSKYLVNGPLMTLKGKLLSIKEIINAEIEAKKSSINSLNVSIDSNKKCLENFDAFIKTVLQSVRVSSIRLSLSQLITNTISEIRSLRESECSNEITEEKYPEPGFIDPVGTKDNVARYNLFISGFESYIRDYMHNLIDSCCNACRTEINKLASSLSNTALIDQKHVDRLCKELINDIVGQITDISVIVDPKMIKSIPKSKQKQWDILRGIFLTEYNDKILSDSEDGLFYKFKVKVNFIDFVNTASDKVCDLQKEIEKSLNESPTEKLREVKKLELEVENLNSELSSIENKISIIDSLKEELN